MNDSNMSVPPSASTPINVPDADERLKELHGMSITEAIKAIRGFLKPKMPMNPVFLNEIKRIAETSVWDVPLALELVEDESLEKLLPGEMEILQSQRNRFITSINYPLPYPEYSGTRHDIDKDIERRAVQLIAFVRTQTKKMMETSKARKSEKQNYSGMKRSKLKSGENSPQASPSSMPANIENRVLLSTIRQPYLTNSTLKPSVETCTSPDHNTEISVIEHNENAPELNDAGVSFVSCHGGIIEDNKALSVNANEKSLSPSDLNPQIIEPYSTPDKPKKKTELAENIWVSWYRKFLVCLLDESKQEIISRTLRVVAESNWLYSRKSNHSGRLLENPKSWFRLEFIRMAREKKFSGTGLDFIHASMFDAEIACKDLLEQAEKAKTQLTFERERYQALQQSNVVNANKIDALQEYLNKKTTEARSAAENNAHLTIKVDELSTALVAEKEIRQRLDEQWKQRIDREATIQKNKIKEKIRFPLEEALRCLDREGNPNVKMAIERMRQIFIALDIGEGKGR